MKQKNPPMITPIYLKTQADSPWPAKDGTFYLLTAEGLFLCRNHRFFTSSTQARGWPGELAGHKAFMRVTYPKLPRRLLELCVGFFSRIAELHQAEAAVALAWDENAGRVRLIVPEQVSIVHKKWGGGHYPVSVQYEIPPLGPGLVLMGDIHCHVYDPAYSSYMDKHDETHRPGLHIVVGKIDTEPPEFHIEAVVDGTRFTVARELVIGGYEKRRENVPDAWIDKVKIEVQDSYSNTRSYGSGEYDYGYGYSNGSGQTYSTGQSWTPDGAPGQASQGEYGQEMPDDPTE